MRIDTGTAKPSGVLKMEDQHLENVSCNLCGGTRSVLWRERLDEKVGHRFKNMRCLDCGLIYVSPRLRPEFRGTFNSWEAISGRAPEYEAQANYHTFTARQRLRKLEAYLGGPGKILDVGCAMGYFLHTAQERGWEVQGVEFDPKPAAAAREKFGLTVTVGTLEKARFKDNEFDCVHINDVIEHLPNPLGALREARRIMKPRSILFVGTHNVSSLRARLDGNRWRDLGGLDHLYCFSPNTMKQMLLQAGFDIWRTTCGEGLGPIARIFKGSGLAEAYKAVEENALWKGIYQASMSLRAFTRLGSEIQFYGVSK